MNIRATIPIAAAVLAMALTACSGGGQPRPSNPASIASSLAMVVGNHANNPDGLTDAASYLNAVVAGQGRVAIIEVDGQPRETAVAELASQANNVTARKLEVSRYDGQLSAAVSAAQPKVAEDDLLAGIALAAQWLRGKPAERLVIRDSGLQTAGQLQFQQPGMLAAAAADVVAQLRDSANLPDLAGVDVTLIGIGDVTAPQPSLDIAQRANLIAIWSAILSASGANVTVDSTPQTGAAPMPAPAVSVVPVPSTMVTLPPCQRPAPIAPTSLSAAAFFVGDRATLLDPAQATATLRPLAQYAIKSGATISLVGTTARVGDRAGQLALSLQRAVALRDVLAGLAVPAAQLAAPTGVGSYWPGYVTDHDASGALIAGAAALNRSVIVSTTLPATGPTTTTC